MSFRSACLPAIGLWVALVAVAPPVAAAGTPAVFDQVLADKTRVGFVFRQMNVPVEGHFRTARTALVFDASEPSKSSVRLELDLGSIDAGSTEANEEVVTKPWFNLKAFPTATFVSTAVTPLGGDRFELAGKLSIKGKEREVRTPVTVVRNGNTATFEGKFTLRRLEFGVGDGLWADTSVVADEVEIRFRAAATQKSN